MKISVIIPAFNEEDRIESCLKSVFDQTYPAFEVIVVDNASTDNTSNIAKALGAKVVIEKEKGITPARNLGFNAATGEIIARTDADTIVPSNWLETINRDFEKDDKLLAVSGPAVFGMRVFSPLLRFIVFEANKKIFGHPCLYGPNLAIKKTTWEMVKNDVCFDDDKVHEDVDLAIHIGKVGKIAYDKSLKVKTSARRLRHNPSSLFIEYLVKWADTIALHKAYRITSFSRSIRNRIRN